MYKIKDLDSEAVSIRLLDCTCSYLLLIRKINN